MELLRFTLKAAARRKLLWLSFLVGFLALNAWNIWQLLRLEEIRFASYLWQNQELGLTGFVCFSFLTYEYLSQARQVSLSETLDTCYPRGQQAVFWQVAMLLAMVCLLTLVQVAYHTAAFLLGGMESTMLLSHVLQAVLLNFALILVLGVFLGAALSFVSNRTTAYGVLLGTVLLLSPLSLDAANHFDEYFPELYTVLDYFQLLPPNLDWTPDQMYGLSLEAYRWNISLFWISLLGLVLAYRLWGKWSRAGLAFCAAVLVFCGCQFWGSMQKETDSVIQMNGLRRDSTVSGMFYYWEGRESLSEEATFRVLSYDIELAAERKLEAHVRVAVTPPEDGNVYKFTLWHGYELEALTDGVGIPLEYTRDGPYLEILYDCPGSSGEIVFTYSGTGGKYYSNSQGIALPGYFPYYPMAGYMSLWEEGFPVVNTDFPETEFTVHVDTDLPLISNLEPVGGNAFCGTAGTATIFGGFFEVVEAGGYTYMRLLTDDTAVDFAAVEAATGISLSDRVIMIMPDTIYRSNSRDEDTVVFADHIIVDGYAPEYMTQKLQWWLEGFKSATRNEWREPDAED